MAASQIKLFGKTISFQFPNTIHFNSTIFDDNHEKRKEISYSEEVHSSSSVSDEVTKKSEESDLTKESDISIPTEEPKTPSIETETDSEMEKFENNSKSPLTKPDKLLPCPRCNSAHTKFCYYNNYNLTQPRYFCKNCQRYWTSGGTMRKLEVGSGRRKNKNSSTSQHHQIKVSESIQATQFLDFGSSSPANSKTNFIKKSQNCFGNGFESKEFSCDRSSIGSSDSVGNGARTNHVIRESFNPNSQSFYPVMFYQSPSPWGCFPYFYSPNCNSQILGKRSRETETLPNQEENNLWFPKTQRIDDRDESAKSLIFSALGIKNEKNDKIKMKAVFKAVESNENDEQFVRNNSLALQANPAAFARSLNFHENA